MISFFGIACKSWQERFGYGSRRLTVLLQPEGMNAKRI
jgi:hypothetical protein